MAYCTVCRGLLTFFGIHNGLASFSIILSMYFLGEFAKLRKATISFFMSVRLSVCNTSAPTGRIFLKFVISLFIEKLSRKSKFLQHLTRVTGTLHEDYRIFLIISRPVLLRMRNVPDKSCTENQNTLCAFSNFLLENRSFNEIMWKNMVEPYRPKMTIRRMRIACWIPKATDTHSLCNT